MSDAKGGNKSQDGSEKQGEGGRWVEGTSAVYRRSLVQDFYPAELRRNLWMPFPYPQDTNSTLPTRLLSFYRSYIPRRNGCLQSVARPDSQKFVSLRTYRFSTFAGTWLGMDNTIDLSSFRDFYPIIMLIL